MLENYLHYFYDDMQYLWDYMTDGLIIADDPDRIYEALDLRDAERREDFRVLLERGQAVPYDYRIFSHKEDLYRIYERENVYVLTPFAKKIKGIETFAELHNVVSRQPVVFNGRLLLVAVCPSSSVIDTLISYVPAFAGVPANVREPS